MTKFIKNVLLFIIIPLIIVIILNSLINPYYANDYYNTKYKYYIKNKEKYNTVVFGSSRLYRQFIPSQFDCYLSEFNTSTFNLAAPHTFNPEVYYLYEKFISKMDSNSLRFAFIELQPLNYISDLNIKSSESYYWCNLKYLRFSLCYIFNANYLNVYKDQLSAYLKSFLFRFTDISKYKYFFLKNNINNTILGNNLDGYYSLDQQSIDVDGENEFKKRKNSFLNDTTVTQQRLYKSVEILSENLIQKYLNKTHLHKLLKIIEESKKKGINVIFIIPPKLDDYKELYALKISLPNRNIIDISNANIYPLLYQTEYTFDEGHLNFKGAELFTTYLANEMNEKYF